MADITAIIAYLDKYLEESGNTAVTAVKANELLADQGLLRDSEHRPGLPLRNLLREDLIPHAYQIPKKKYGKWYIPKSRGRKIGQGETSSEKKGGKVGVLTPQNDGPTRVPNPKIEVIRRKYKPAKIKILFIGESPPAGGTFFYDGNSNLAKYTKSAFENCFGTSISQMPEFLRFFKEQGCFLDDLCLYPINNIKDKYQRNGERERNVKLLAIRIRDANPDVIFVVMKAIVPYVNNAIRLAGLAGAKRFELVFPALGNQDRYVSELESALIELKGTNLLAR